MEKLVVVVALVLLLALLFKAAVHPWRMRIALALVLVFALKAASWQLVTGEDHLRQVRIRRQLPTPSRDDQFVSSNACRACHPDAYDSWHHSFHRTMTQVAGADSVLGDFHNVRLEQDGYSFLLQQRNDEYWATMRPLGVAKAPGDDVQIVMTTGSHHYQVYWTAGDPQAVENGVSNCTLVAFPFAYHLEAKRWIPREAALVMPPKSRQSTVVWNGICIRCHSTHGQPRLNIDRQTSRLLGAETQVAELGISCESCHGPAETHVRANQSPWRRYDLRQRGVADETIVQPARLSAPRSAELCGQCHAISSYAKRDNWHGGWNEFRPGDELAKTLNVIRPNHAETLAPIRAALDADPAYLDGRYWSDGQVRVSGREYNGLIESPCYQGQTLSCLSCHSLHHYQDRDDQLKPDMDGDQACLQCHAAHRQNIPAHTHHAPESAGSRCYNCHMPHTTYGLLKAIRSHQISSPDVAASVATGRPNACNVCHTNRSLAWTQQHLKNWYGAQAVPLSTDDQQSSSTVLALLRGDAGQRALAAWNLGWPESHQASGQDWQAPYLAQLLEDPYAAVRYIAARSLRRMPGFDEWEYDFVAPASELAKSRGQAQSQWSRSHQPQQQLARPEILIDAQGQLDWTRFHELLKQRNDRPVDLQE